MQTQEFVSNEEVRIAQGRLKGIREEGVTAFHGVPYAKPPVGELRFRRPREAAPWTGTLDATKARAASLQNNHANQKRIDAFVKEMDPGVPGIVVWPGYAGSTYNQDVVGEDCLYNDIWVPDSAEKGKLPVFIYYHGGANAMSSGHFPLERGANLAREENVIVIRPTYRLGALGWVNFGLVSDALSEAVNLGVHDQIAALRWVYQNIEEFGGDPSNITVGGESCGATATSHLLVNSEARPMIRRAVLESLSPFHNWCTQPRDIATAVAGLYLEILKIEDAEKLMTIDPEKFLAVQNIMTRLFDADKNCAWRPLGAVVDGLTVPDHPAAILSRPEFDGEGLELLIGVAKDEWQFFRGHSHTAQHGTEQDVLAVFAQVFSEAGARKVYDSYRELYPGREPGHTLGDVMSFEFFKFSSMAIARHLSQQGVPVFMFEYAYDLPGYGGYLRAVHTGDTPFVFRNLSEADLKQWPGFDGTDRADLKRVAADFGQLYGSFLRTGNPGARWPRFEVESETILWFGKQVEARPHLLSREREIFLQQGITDVPALEQILAGNTRAALNSKSKENR